MILNVISPMLGGGQYPLETVKINKDSDWTTYPDYTIRITVQDLLNSGIEFLKGTYRYMLITLIFKKDGSVIAATDAAIMFQYQLQASGSYWYDFNLGQSFNAVTIYNGGIYNGTCKGSSSGASTSLTIDIGVASSSSNMFSYDTIEAYAAFPLEN